MNKKGLIVSFLSLSAVAVSVGIVTLNKNAESFSSAKATEVRTITWNKDTGATAETTDGNEIKLGSRYLKEWTFGGDYFATSTGTNTFIDNFTNGDHPFQSIKSVTINYTYSSNQLKLSVLAAGGYSYNQDARIASVVSGTKYEIGSEQFDYVNCNKSDTFRWFYIQSSSGEVNISSVVVEYACSYAA